MGMTLTRNCLYLMIENDKSRIQKSGVTIQTKVVHFASSPKFNTIWKQIK